MIKIFFLKFTLLTSILVSAGCATGPSFKADLLAQLENGLARIVLGRSYSHQGSAQYPQVRVNGQTVRELTLGGFAVIDVKPGANKVQLVAGSLAWKISYGAMIFDYKLDDKETLYLRLQMATGTSGWTMNGRAMPAADYESKPAGEKTATNMLPGLMEAMHA